MEAGKPDLLKTYGLKCLNSLALRLHRICSTDAKFKHRINELKTYLLARGYNYNFLEEQFLRAANISRTNALQTKPKASNDVVPFVVSYNPALRIPRISNILRKHFNIVHSSNRCKDVFKQPPFVAYRRSPNLRAVSYTHLTLPTNREV